MDRETFTRHLLAASERARDFATRYVTNELPILCRYLIEVGSHQIDRPRRTDGTPFPFVSREVRAHTERYVGPVDADGVVEFLWRDGAVPRWVDVAAHSADGKYTYLGLMCGQFESDDNKLYYRPGFSDRLMHDLPPFQVCGPWLPPGWEHERAEKFDLHWRFK